MQIDWISAVIECPEWARRGYQGFDTGRVLLVDREGESRRIGSGSEFLEGSHESRIMLKSSRGSDLFLSGNPVKHIQGHNLFGSDDALALFFDVGDRLREGRIVFPGPGTWRSEGFAGPRFTRLDLTRSYRFASDAHALEWLRDVGSYGLSRHGATELVGGSTVYLGKKSEHWKFKIYSKSEELRTGGVGHRLSPTLRDGAREQLLAWSEGIVRFELTLMSKQLEQLTREFVPLAVWEDYFRRITWNRNATMDASADLVDGVAALSKSLQRVIMLWRTGADLRRVYPKTSFWRFRREIYQAIGVDIAAPPPDARGRPMVRAGLEAHRWDPAPLESHMYHPNAALKDLYGPGVEVKKPRR